MENSSGNTLIPFINADVQVGSTVVTYEWSGYNRLSTSGYIHETVNQQKHFVDPATGYHTQAIERSWVDGKAWMKRARGPGPLLQSHLDEYSWHKLR